MKNSFLLSVGAALVLALGRLSPGAERGMVLAGGLASLARFAIHGGYMLGFATDGIVQEVAGMEVVHSVRSTFSRDLAIDLGTANTLIYLRGEGIVCDEPSMIAARHDSNGSRHMLAVREEAKKMWGRSPGSIGVSRPIREGSIADFETTS
jgi:hypothetical protein